MRPELDKKLKEVIYAATTRTSLNAKQFAPVVDSGLKNSIHYMSQDRGLTGVVYAWKEYAPYVEFGTGFLVTVPSELKDYAMQFKGAGIRQVNLRPRPYLYPAFFINRQRFIKACDMMLKELL